MPAGYKREWKYLAPNTDLWRKWRGDECGETAPEEGRRLKAETPRNMILLACLGPDQCQRDLRALSCRQFPFFPYVTSGHRFIGPAYEWQFESVCWVNSYLQDVTQRFREGFVGTDDRLFALFQEEFEHYAYHSEMIRAEFIRRRKRFPLLHRNGDYYLVSPSGERLERVEADRLPRFGVYRS